MSNISSATPKAKTKAKAKAKTKPERRAKGRTAAAKTKDSTKTKKTGSPAPQRRSVGPSGRPSVGRSEGSFEERDEAFMQDIANKLKKIEDTVRSMPESESELAAFCKRQCAPLAEIIATISIKSKSSKRRKVTDGDNVTTSADKFDETLKFASSLKRVLQELSTNNPDANELDTNMTDVEANSTLMFPVCAQLKRWKALVLEKLRFNKFEEISMMLCASSLEDHCILAVSCCCSLMAITLRGILSTFHRRQPRYVVWHFLICFLIDKQPNKGHSVVTDSAITWPRTPKQARSGKKNRLKQAPWDP